MKHQAGEEGAVLDGLGVDVRQKSLGELVAADVADLGGGVLVRHAQVQDASSFEAGLARLRICPAILGMDRVARRSPIDVAISVHRGRAAKVQCLGRIVRLDSLSGHQNFIRR